jgi:hypothetical protein
VTSSTPGGIVKRLSLVAAIGGALVCLVLPGLGAASGIYICTGTVGGPLPGQFTASTIDSNVYVPAGATCSLYGVTVTGNVIVQGTLNGFGNTFDKDLIVNGGSVSFGCFGSVLCGGHGGDFILGNAVMTNTGPLVLLQSHYAMNLAITGATSVDLELMGAFGRVTVTGSANVLLFSATYGSDVSLINNENVVVAGVTIAGTLSCFANTPAPTVGPGVEAAGYRGQCVPGG